MEHHSVGFHLSSTILTISYSEHLNVWNETHFNLEVGENILHMLHLLKAFLGPDFSMAQCVTHRVHLINVAHINGRGVGS